MGEPNPEPRLGKSAKEQIAEIEKAVKALLKGMKALEEETGEPYMPTGEYLGEKFED